jgi:hypothetical protein
MSGRCRMLRKDEECKQQISLKNLKERDQLGDLGVDGIIILKCILRSRQKSCIMKIYEIILFLNLPKY